MNLKVNKNFKTRGGWKCRIIWERVNVLADGKYLVIHKPGSKTFESGAIIHEIDGKARAIWSIGAPPNYLDNCDADIVGEWTLTDEKKEKELQAKFDEILSRQNAEHN